MPLKAERQRAAEVEQRHDDQKNAHGSARPSARDTASWPLICITWAIAAPASEAREQPPVVPVGRQLALDQIGASGWCAGSRRAARRGPSSHAASVSGTASAASTRAASGIGNERTPTTPSAPTHTSATKPVARCATTVVSARARRLPAGEKQRAADVAGDRAGREQVHVHAAEVVEAITRPNGASKPTARVEQPPARSALTTWLPT